MFMEISALHFMPGLYQFQGSHFIIEIATLYDKVSYNDVKTDISQITFVFRGG